MDTYKMYKLADKIAEHLNKTHFCTQEFVDYWQQEGVFTLPNETDCLDFIMTEVAEAIDARLRKNTEYTRNNGGHTDVDKEIADVMFMCMVYFMMSGSKSPGEILAENIEKRHLKFIDKFDS